MPHLNGRAVTLRRFPEGVEDLDSAFFEKRCPKHRPKWVKTASVRAGPNAGKIDFCVCDSLPTLVWMAQLAAIELHPSLSRSRAPNRPTVLAFDLDPGPPADVVDCCRVALRLRALFDHFGIEAFPKTSGSKGMQVYVPLNRKDVSYEETKPLAKAIAQLLEKETPDLVVSKMKKVDRQGQDLRRLVAEPPQQNDGLGLLDAGSRAADGLDAGQLGRGRTRRRARRRRLARVRDRRRAGADREARRPLRARPRARTGAAELLTGDLGNLAFL